MKLTIELSNAGRRGTISIDGVKVPNVRSVDFHAGVGSLPTAVLTLIAPDVEIVTELEARGIKVFTEETKP